MKIFLILSLLSHFAFADLISGIVTEQGTGTPLSGVQVSLSTVSVNTATDGSYSINSESPSSTVPKYSAEKIQWFLENGILSWSHSEDWSIRFHSLDGTLLDQTNSRLSSSKNSYRIFTGTEGICFLTLSFRDKTLLYQIFQSGDSSPRVRLLEKNHETSGTLKKNTALNNLTYSKSNYITTNRQISGSQSNVDVTLAPEIWNQSNLTWYTSWPDPGSDECLYYNGCQWAGYFAGLPNQMDETWVSENNIVAVHEKDWNTYRGKTLRLRKGSSEIDAVVYDMCADSDCNGCCTTNATQNGLNFLLDIESYTKDRFGESSGIVEWRCLDC